MDEEFLTVPELPTEIDEEFDHLDWCFEGAATIAERAGEGFQQLTGSESHYSLLSDMFRLAGNEAGVMDAAKDMAKKLYENITAMLKRISTYFFGDAKKSAEGALENAEEGIKALADLEGNAPIPEDSPLRNPDNIIKALDGGAEYNEIKEENRDLGSAMEKIRAAAEKVKGCDTVAKLRTVLNEVYAASSQGIQSVGNSLRKTLSETQRSADKLRNLKVPADDDTPEVKSGIKEENKELSDEAKEGTRKARIIGGMQNKIVAGLNSVSKMAKGVKEKPAKSNFKG